MKILLGIHHQVLSWKRRETQGRELLNFHVIVILCFHFNFVCAVYYQTRRLTFEMICMRREPVYLTWETLTRSYFHRCRSNYLFAILGVLGMSLCVTFMRYVHFWCQNNHMATCWLFNCNTLHKCWHLITD